MKLRKPLIAGVKKVIYAYPFLPDTPPMGENLEKV